MADSRPGLGGPILIAAVITLLVTIVRVVGEMQGWHPTLFSTEPGGGGSPFGITLLILVFGFWFGRRLAKAGAANSLGRAAGLYFVALLAFGGAIFALYQAGLIAFPSEEKPGPFIGGQYLLAAMAVAAVLALIAWPRLTGALMLYGILARLPVIVVTYLDVKNGWGTHYGKLPPFVLLAPEDDLTLTLCMPQMTFWPFVATPIVGGLVGCLGAKLTRKGSSPLVKPKA